MNSLKIKVGLAVVALVPSLALAVPFTTTSNVKQDVALNAESIFSGGITGNVKFDRTPTISTGTTLSYTTGLDVPVVSTFGGLTNGQTPTLLGDANGDGGTVEAIGFNPGAVGTAQIAGADFSFNTSSYSRGVNGRYPSTAYVPGTSGPVAVNRDNNMVGASLLTGFGVQRGSGFGGDELIGGFGSITVVFDELVSGFGGYVGSLETVGSITLVTFGNDGAELARVTSVRDEATDNTGLGAFDLLAVEDQASENIIKAATFIQTLPDEIGFNLDYVVFERTLATNPPADPVVAPASLLLLLLGWPAVSRRRKRSA